MHKPDDFENLPETLASDEAPPNQRELELTVLRACCGCSPENASSQAILERMDDILNARCFVDMGDVAAAIRACLRAEGQVDSEMLGELLRDGGARVPKDFDVNALFDKSKMPPAWLAFRCADLLKQEAQRRQMTTRLTEALRALEVGKRPESVYIRLLSAMETGREPSLRTPNNSERLPNVIDNLTDPANRAIPVNAFKGDGVNLLLNGGLQREHVVALAAGTGRGKTTWALQLVDGIAQDNIKRVRSGAPVIPCLYLAADNQRAADLITKTISRLAELDGGKLEAKVWKREPNAAETETRLKGAAERYNTFATYITIRDNAEALKVDEVQLEVRRLLRSHNAETCVVVIDPLHGLRTGEQHLDQTESERISKVAAQIKHMASELDVAVLALSDTTKDALNKGHAGDVDFRGAYQFNHPADVTLLLRVYNNAQELIRDFKAGSEKDTEWQFTAQRIVDANPLTTFHEQAQWKHTRYVAVFCSKQRSGVIRHLFFAYHMATNTFEELR